jgi:hypothetical protein
VPAFFASADLIFAKLITPQFRWLHAKLLDHRENHCGDTDAPADQPGRGRVNRIRRKKSIHKLRTKKALPEGRAG